MAWRTYYECNIYRMASGLTVVADFTSSGSYPNCTHGNINSAVIYANKLNGALSDNFWTTGHSYRTYHNVTNSGLTINNLKMIKNHAATLLVYAGHGKVNNNINNSWHLNGTRKHSGSEESTAYDYNFSLTAAANGSHQYIVAYTCNYLTNGGYLEKMANMHRLRARVLCGYASTVYVHSDEGTYFGNLLRTQSVRSAFLNATREYQTYRNTGTTSIARVQGLNSSYHEMIYSGNGLPPSYDNNKSLYGVMQDLRVTGR